jgi:hypothetical protein
VAQARSPWPMATTALANERPARGPCGLRTGCSPPAANPASPIEFTVMPVARDRLHVEDGEQRLKRCLAPHLGHGTSPSSAVVVAGPAAAGTGGGR